jgi:hypothetical protein
MSGVFFEKDNISGLIEHSNCMEKIKEGDIAAVKIHWGEKGNKTHIKPEYVKAVVDKIKELGGKPFITDTTTLYDNQRHDAVSSLAVAREHGFTEEKIGAPIIVADGIYGFSGIKIKISGHELNEIEVAQGIYEADFLISLAHVKGHLLTGFGGAIKNLGMGCVTKNGKRSQHLVNLPQWSHGNCVQCRKCVDACRYGALKFDENEKFAIDEDKCWACLRCVFACPNDALKFTGEGKIHLQYRLSDACSGVLKKFKNNSVFINCAVNITKECDCSGGRNPIVMPDIGFFASDDIVAVDSASLDFMNRHKKFSDIHGIDPEIQVKAAESIGLGTRKYELIEI